MSDKDTERNERINDLIVYAASYMVTDQTQTTLLLIQKLPSNQQQDTVTALSNMITDFRNSIVKRLEEISVEDK